MTRRSIFGVLLVLLTLFGLALLLEDRQPKNVVAGPAHVVDGDTLRIEGQAIRLAGLDAPELRQTCERAGQPYACGETARAELRRLVQGEVVTCSIRGRDKYRRLLGRCAVRGEDLGVSLVSRGLAVAYGGYAREEDAARRAGAGLWAGPFEPPAEWRKEHGVGRR